MSQATGNSAPRPPSQKLMKFGIAGAVLLVLAGGAAFYYASTKVRTGAANGAIVVTISEGKCDPNTLTVPAGRTTFNIVNKSDRALEWEILDGVMVLEERENIVPGFTQTLTAKLNPGKYEITCGLLTSPRGSLTVMPSAEASAAAARPALVAFVGPLAEYQVFLATQSSALVKGVQALDDAIKAGDIDKAREAYQKARLPYMQMEPIADRFADLHNAIDPVADYLEKREADAGFTGFHRIEYGLYSTANLDGLTPVSAKLLADVTALKDRVRSLRIPPDQIASGAARLINTIASTRIAAGEDHYAKSDLLDFEANIAGVSRMMALMKPVVAQGSPAVMADIETRIAAVDGALKALRGPVGFPPYDNVNADSRKALAAQMQALADSIGKLNAAVGLE
ncbi:iron uptake system protein EfeO (plasmid) [Phyllobacterium sp. 628]|uniref:iron uptake system protein EfeO n=1 Tax=Phyllobacterium sp. 628 TaxID=2718938 RepID=UPI001662835B|nr:iron uptake system protein EfeO [Phyllobacterium sp. 628]QND54591.1 iron uptake system protein EfeO [Phyllobacterium sp. 628]